MLILKPMSLTSNFASMVLDIQHIFSFLPLVEVKGTRCRSLLCRGIKRSLSFHGHRWAPPNIGFIPTFSR